MEVPFFRYRHVFESHGPLIERAMLGCAAQGGYIMQRELREFEEALAEYCGVAHAVGVGNATDGIEMNLSVAGIGVGDEVILPSHTFVASASAVVAVGATPVFAEIGPDHLLDPDDVIARITDRTRAIMPTQLNGRTANMERLGEIATEHDLVIVEDSAQGIGSRFCGRMAGTFGVAGVFSFYPAKVLGGLGDGGAVFTNDDDVAAELRRLRDHGRDPETGEVLSWGRNSRLDNIQAAVLSVKLGTIDEELERRRELAARYDKGLGGIAELSLPPSPAEASGSPHFDVYQNYEIEADSRDELRAHLSEHRVGTILQWGGNGVHQFEGLGVRQSLPFTERVMSKAMLLPMNTSLTNDEVDYVCEVIRGFYGDHQPVAGG